MVILPIEGISVILPIKGISIILPIEGISIKLTTFSKVYTDDPFGRSHAIRLKSPLFSPNGRTNSCGSFGLNSILVMRST